MIENGEYKISIEHRLTSLETNVREIKDNHLPHIERKIDRAYWFLITTLATVILSLIMIFFKR